VATTQRLQSSPASAEDAHGQLHFAYYDYKSKLYPARMSAYHTMLKTLCTSYYLVPQIYTIISTSMQQAKLHSAAILAQSGVKESCMNQHKSNGLLQQEINQIKITQIVSNLSKRKFQLYSSLLYQCHIKDYLLSQPPIQKKKLKKLLTSISHIKKCQSNCVD
jgi:hypothetical protein